jgi:hypothetical protein
MLLRYIYVDSRNTITNNRIQQYNHCQHRPAQSSGQEDCEEEGSGQEEGSSEEKEIE